MADIDNGTTNAVSSDVNNKEIELRQGYIILLFLNKRKNKG